MTQTYQPTSDIDVSLLASIPQKVYGWLTFLAAIDRCYYQDMSWDFGEEASFIFVDGETPIHIRIEGPLTKPDVVTGTETWMADISNNLDSFIKFERRIYDMLEELTEEIQEQDPAEKFVRTTKDLTETRIEPPQND